MTNDDGVNSEGLWSLANSLRDLGRVCVVAPDRDMSGKGTAMTLLDVLRTHKAPSPIEGVEAHSVQGTPSDCVILATASLYEEPFDLLFSGINQGSNTGLDLLGSGTVGGALQGYYRDIPSIAISVASLVDTKYEAACRAATALARSLAASPPEGPLLLNVNLPNVGPEDIEGVEVTRLGPRAYLEDVQLGHDGRRTHYWIKNRKSTEQQPEGTDTWAVENNRVSITPIDLVPTTQATSSTLQALAADLRSAFGLP